MKKHNQWMKILQAVFSALAGLFGSLRFHQESNNPEKSNNPEESGDIQ